ncbi:MAG: sulfatase-like hydrolase/transferase [Candidatus Binatia bacterium]|nr:sulfatase-like hydrolase/transferase [Candidatus Binatia bacterium]
MGEVRQALRDNGVEDDTLVLFSSDHGGAHYTGLPEINVPYRGWKMIFFEGEAHSFFFAK